jgi:peptidoglycan/xylan/chitin deacetylase (PgdA/CDA1 family)
MAQMNAIKGAFFVQTNVPPRLPATKGRTLALRAHQEGHVLGIHTGSKKDHVCHKRRFAAAMDADQPGTVNGLDSDMKRAKAQLHAVTGITPTFVRATYGVMDEACSKIYTKNGLSHVYWDVDFDDKKPLTYDNACKLLKEGLIQSLKQKKTTIVVLMHDVTNRLTYQYLPEYIGLIVGVIKAAKQNPVFPTTQGEVAAILAAKAGRGADIPCPAKLP